MQDIRPLARAAVDLTPEGMDFLSLIGGSSIVVGAPHRQGERFRALLAWVAGNDEPIDLDGFRHLRHQAVEGALATPDGPHLTESQLGWLSVPTHARAYADALDLDTDGVIPVSAICHDLMRRQLLEDVAEIAEGIKFRLEADVDSEVSFTP